MVTINDFEKGKWWDEEMEKDLLLLKKEELRENEFCFAKEIRGEDWGKCMSQRITPEVQEEIDKMLTLLTEVF